MERQTIGSIASRQVIHAAPEVPVTEALALMAERQISCVLAVLQDTVVGILTERDVVREAGKILTYPTLQLREVMTTPVLCVQAELPALDAYRLLKQNEIRHLAVHDCNYDIAGVATLTDLVTRLTADHFSDLPNIGAYMSTDMKTVTSDQPVRHALLTMSGRGISCVVVEDGGRPVGMFTERDVTRLVASRGALLSTPIGNLMSRPVASVHPSLSALQAIDRMKSQGIRRLVVVDAQGRLEGLLTQSDIARMLEARLGRYLAERGCASGFAAGGGS